MSGNNLRYLRCLLLGIIISGLPLSAGAQFYFGQNKVQYTHFDWQVMETEHFRIYFYIEEEDLAKIAARIAEDGYQVLASRFRQEVYSPIPLIIYSSPNYFSQTNVTEELLPESVGGFTEFMKGRVVVPFHGSYYDFKHVIRHELVHVFTLAKLESIMTRQTYIKMAPPPLWFMEGLAEYWSTAWDTEADMILKDMVLAGRLFPISRFYEISGTFFMYKLGQSVCQFINDEYGSDKLVLLFENWWKGDNFEAIVRLTLSDDLNDVSRKWEYSLKKKYFPQMTNMGLADRDAHQLTKSGFAVKPVPVHLDDGLNTGDWVIYKANRMGYTGLYMMPPAGEERKIITILKGERSSSFESMHLLQSGIDAHGSGLILFSSKSEENDVLYVYDLNKHEIKKKFEIPGMAAIVSPRFSPDGKFAVFGGAVKSGVSDIFLINLETGDLKNITNDFYYDLDPAFSLTGDSIIFCSDRCSDGDSGAINMFIMSVNGGEPRALTAGKWRDTGPEPSDSGIYFSSDRDGSFNIYRLNDDRFITKMTTLLTGAYDPRLTPDKKEIVFSGYQNFGFHIFQTNVSDSLNLIADKPKDGTVFWRPSLLDRKFVRSSVQYRTSYSFDIAQSAVSYDPVYGSLGGVQVAVSDMLGEQYFLFSFDQYRPIKK